MYETSESYRQSLDSGYLNTDIKGTITTVEGKVYQFTDKDIVPSSLSWDNKSVNGTDFGYGGVYVGEFAVDLMTEIDRYSMSGAEIKASYFQTTLDGETQEIPLGVFYVYEATRTKKILSLKAYDAMTKFDVTVEENTTGVLYDILVYISEKCGVELAQTEEEINAFINSDWWLTLDAEQISTYREAISQAATITARFATINRDGKLEFRAYHVQNPDDTISARRRTESSIQDFKTWFCSVKARFLATSNYYPYTAVDETIKDGLVLDLGDISLFQGEDDNKKKIVENILAVTTPIIYVPASFSIISDPSVDLGDCLELKSVNYSEVSVITLVHSVSWKYHGAQKIECYGNDPKLAGVVSKEERLLSQLESQISSKDLVVKTYTNSKKLTVKSTAEVETVLFNFAATKDTVVMLMAMIPFEAKTDGTVVIRHYYDGVLDSTATTRQYCDKGMQILTFVNYIPMAADGRSTLKITMQTETSVTETREQNAKILSLLDYVKNQSVAVDESGKPYLVKEYVEQEPDATAMVCEIAKTSVRAVLFAQGLAGAGQWDGTINIVEDFSSVQFTPSQFAVINFAEAIQSVLKSPENKTISESFDETFAGGLEYKIGTMTERIITGEETAPVTAAAEMMRPVNMDLFFSVGRTTEQISIDTE